MNNTLLKTFAEMRVFCIKSLKQLDNAVKNNEEELNADLFIRKKLNEAISIIDDPALSIPVKLAILKDINNKLQTFKNNNYK